MVEDGDRLRPEACQSPVWDTGLAVLALRACGVPADHPQLVRAGEYLLSQEVTVKGDWSIRVPDLAPGGWAFEYENDLYPDIDDAAVISLALRQLDLGDDAVTRGLDWLVGMQSRSGGWGAFDVDNQAMWLYKIPFCDFGKVTDEPSADVTAHALETLGHEEGYDDAVERGLELSARGAGGRRLVVRPLGRQPPLRHRRRAARARGMRRSRLIIPPCGARSPGSTPCSRRAAASARTSARTPTPRGAAARRSPTPSQTGWALLGYVAAGNAEDENARRAADYLCGIQRSDGDWDEEHFTGTGFPLDFMIRYHLYRISFPLLALGRMRERLSA